MKHILILILVAVATILQAQDATQAVSIRTVKQVTADTTLWFAEEIYVVYRGGEPDSMSIVQYINNVNQDKKNQLIARKNRLANEQNQIDSLLISYEKEKGSITESFDSSFIKQAVGTWSLVFAKQATDVKLTRNGIIENLSKKNIGKWKMVAENRILILTDDYEANLEYNEKTKDWVSVDKIKVKLIKSKSK